MNGIRDGAQPRVERVPPAQRHRATVITERKGTDPPIGTSKGAERQINVSHRCPPSNSTDVHAQTTRRPDGNAVVPAISPCSSSEDTRSGNETSRSVPNVRGSA
ncbi:hypothetical protein GCM10010199_09390 [Dactylosporangium roseum]